MVTMVIKRFRLENGLWWNSWVIIMDSHELSKPVLIRIRIPLLNQVYLSKATFQDTVVQFLSVSNPIQKCNDKIVITNRKVEILNTCT